MDIRRGIVITTSEATKEWLRDCLTSLAGCKYPVLIVSNGGYYPESKDLTLPVDLAVNEWNGFELGGIARGAESFDEFIHLMDTCVVKDQGMFDAMFEYPHSVCLTPGFFSYLGKFKSDVLRAVGVPRIETKNEAVLKERWWTEDYLKLDPGYKVFQPELPVESTVFVERHNRKNMVLENDFIIKYKANWGQ